ncbi:hypothetical protein RRG08_023504 [Elysia crispata]|uniref:Uncharacterized protein n=1 Tax=Elysia crispata TaxID=231223 RepID=A0AAE0YZI6_9GAST|nr:hypothetical protein RRG08_023504 [Elysia crispata]
MSAGNSYTVSSAGSFLSKGIKPSAHSIVDYTVTSPISFLLLIGLVKLCLLSMYKRTVLVSNISTRFPSRATTVNATSTAAVQNNNVAYRYSLPILPCSVFLKDTHFSQAVSYRI